MISVLRRYGINTRGEYLPLNKYPYFTVHYEDIRAEIPQMKEYVTYATEGEEHEAHEWSDFDDQSLHLRYTAKLYTYSNYFKMD